MRRHLRYGYVQDVLTIYVDTEGSDIYSAY